MILLTVAIEKHFQEGQRFAQKQPEKSSCLFIGL